MELLCRLTVELRGRPRHRAISRPGSGQAQGLKPRLDMPAITRCGRLSADSLNPRWRFCLDIQALST